MHEVSDDGSHGDQPYCIAVEIAHHPRARGPTDLPRNYCAISLLQRLDEVGRWRLAFTRRLPLDRDRRG